ncbi:MAG: PAS domain S-box protein [Akkermansiaceae bacterium]|nr:PAS domain S-box protein [Akkermansiaceae bacterium]
MRSPAKQTEHRMQGIVDNSPQPIYAKSVTGHYLMVNRRYEDLFGMKSADIVDKTENSSSSTTRWISPSCLRRT